MDRARYDFGRVLGVPAPAWGVGDMADRTRLLAEMIVDARLGNAHAVVALDERLYDELRALAASMMRSQPAGHTLQPTALVHEAFLKTDGFIKKLDPQDRAHLFRSIAKAMRQLLIDAARRKATEKHGGGRRQAWTGSVEQDVIGEGPSEADPETFAQVSKAIDDLDAEDPRAAEVVRLKVFAGCSTAQIAEVLSISERSVHREWEFARRWLTTRLRAEPTP